MAGAIHPPSEKASLLGIPVIRGNGNTLLKERCPHMGYELNSEAPGESGRCYKS